MSQTVPEKLRWTTADLELLSTDEWKRYEIIDGELIVTRAPHLDHQDSGGNVYAELRAWSKVSKLGKAILLPGILFSDADNVIPDVVWISYPRLAQLTDEAGHLTGAPELIVEILSPGTTNERRDREVKLKLYSAQGVQEYWIVNYQLQQLELYRREAQVLKLVATLFVQDTLTSPLLPGFACEVGAFFE
jgi:Uma2 family endonuclease